MITRKLDGTDTSLDTLRETSEMLCHWYFYAHKRGSHERHLYLDAWDAVSAMVAAVILENAA